MTSSYSSTARGGRVFLSVLPGLLLFANGVHASSDVSVRSIPLGKQITFEKNQGQTRPDVRFFSRSAGGRLALTDRAALIQISGEAVNAAACGTAGRFSTVRLSFPGSSGGSRPIGGALSETKSHYYRGNDPSRWISNVPHYTSVRYPSIYEGIDLVYYGNDGQLEYDFVIAPGASPGRIRMRFDGGNATLQKDGNVLVKTANGSFTQLAPVVYQEGAARKYVAAKYVQKGRDFTVFVGAYDRRAPLVIDPVIRYSTYLGGSAFFGESSHDLALSGTDGSSVLVGETSSTDFPTSATPADGTYGGGMRDAFVTKFNEDGTLAWSTFLGGSNDDLARAVAYASGMIWVVGESDSSDFPSTSPINPNLGGKDAFLTQFNSSGAMTRSFRFGGASTDSAYGVTIAASGHAYVVGFTGSSGAFGTAGAFDAGYNGSVDGFLVKLTSDATTTVWSTYIGGSGEDKIFGVASDGLSNAYVTGHSTSPNLPVAGGFQTSFGGGTLDAFVYKITSGGAFSYGTYLGGSGNDAGRSIDVTSGGSAYVGGETRSTNFPLQNALLSSLGGFVDGFVTALNAGGTALLHSTYLGGSDADFLQAIDVDETSDQGLRILVAGSTSSTNFPLANSLDSTLDGNTDGFVTLMRAAPKDGLLFSTYYGGSGGESANGAVLQTLYTPGQPSRPAISLSGNTLSTDFPLRSGVFFATAFQTVVKGSGDAFAARLVFQRFDPNSDAAITVADVFYLVNFLFAAGPPPAAGSADANGDSAVTVADVFYTVNYLFAGGPLPG